MNVIVMGRLCAYRLDDFKSDLRCLLSSTFRLRRQPELTSGNARRCTGFFLFARNLLYLLVFVTSGPAALLAVVRPIAGQYPKKGKSMARNGPESDKKRGVRRNSCQIDRKPRNFSKARS